MDDSRGCIKVGLFYIMCLGIFLIVVSLRSCYAEPTVSDVKIVQTTEGVKYKYSNDRYQCPSKSSFYCVVKSDSIERPGRNDTCLNCGELLRNHYYIKDKEEEKMEDAIRNAFTDTPAE